MRTTLTKLFNWGSGTKNSSIQSEMKSENSRNYRPQFYSLESD